MTITPTGLPAWTRTADHTQYGGHTEKRDFMGVGPINPRTDVAAAELCRAAADLAATARTAPMWVLVFQCNDSSPAAPTVEVALGMTGVRFTSYEADNPPTGFPSAVRGGNGQVTFTFESSYADDYGTDGDYGVLVATGSASSTSARIVTATTTATTVTVRVFDDAGAAVSDPLVCLEVV